MSEEPYRITSIEQIERLGLPKGSKVSLPTYITIVFDIETLEAEVQKGKSRLFRIGSFVALASILLTVTWFSGNLLASFGFSLATCYGISWFFYASYSHAKFSRMFDNYLMLYTYLRTSGYEIVNSEEGDG